MPDDNSTIIINLAEALNASACKTGTLLQVQAKKQLGNLLEKFEQQSKDIKTKNNSSSHSSDEWELEFNPKRYNNTIFISGQRGAGKTTFLRSVLLDKAEPGNKIKPIAFIDPTLIEVHEHILVQIIAKVQASVTNALSRASDEPQRHEFQTCMEEMAEGLKLLGSGDNNKAQDPAFFLNKALKHAVGGQNLERKFNELIDKAAKILGVNLLIIAFDDVDTNTTQAFNVLELIRKYLTSPNLVVLISGDPSLYSHIVQGQRAKELNNGNFAIKGMDELSQSLPEMVSHLEQQYLAKVLPVEHRIELKNLANLIEHPVKIKVKLKDEVKEIINPPIEIKSHIENVISESLKINPEDITPYVNFLLEQPIRTILQILKSVDESQEINSQSLFTALRDSYIGDLRKENIPIEKLSDQSIHPHTIGMALFNLCKNNGEFETGFYARPDGNSTSYNSSMFVMSSVISNYLNPEKSDFNQSAGRFLQLMLAGPATSTIFMNNVREKMIEKANHNNFIDYIGLNKRQNSFSLAAHFSRLLYISDIELGVLKIPRSIPSNFSHQPFKSLINKNIISKSNGAYGSNSEMGMGGIETLESITPSNSNDKEIFSLAAKTIALASHSVAMTSNKIDFISVHCLLASISELLLCEEKDLNRKLNLLSQMPTYGSPDFIKDTNVKSDNSAENVGVLYLDEEASEVTSYINAWKNQNKTKHNGLSSLLLGKIWTRIHYTLETVSTNMIGENKLLLSEAIERFIWVILNSFLIEEARYVFNSDQNIKAKLSKARNVVSASTFLTNNLKSVAKIANMKGKNLKDKLPLTYLMLTCPLFLPYLATTTAGKESVTEEPVLEESNIVKNRKSKVDLFKEIKSIIISENDAVFIEKFSNIEQKSAQAMVLISRFVVAGKFGTNK
jgi:GTPase SAR1 family protein